MKLSQKTFLYSAIISAVFVALFLGYFCLMLPSLYVDYKKNLDYEKAVSVHKKFVASSSYHEIDVDNPTSTLTAVIPMEENTLHVYSKYFEASLGIEDAKIISLLDQLREMAKGFDGDNLSSVKESDIDVDGLMDYLLDKIKSKGESSVHIELKTMAPDISGKNVGTIFHLVDAETFGMETYMSDGNNYFSANFAFTAQSDKLILTIVSTMTPQMKEIQPIILQSLPMILAVGFLLVLVLSQTAARFLVNPMIRLAQHANRIQNSNMTKVKPLELTGKDEISELGTALNDLYDKLLGSYEQIQQKNEYLAMENKRQEMFLRASSHQLKTPIAAALLLVDGMIAKIGKYSDTEKYLPEVKAQLKSMQKLVEDILYLNHCTDETTWQPIDLSALVSGCMQAYQLRCQEKQIQTTLHTDNAESRYPTDAGLLKKVVDNVISNAVDYSKEGASITVTVTKNSITVVNTMASINAELLPHIFEPFVTGNEEKRGHGLGLYVANYYIAVLHGTLTIENGKDCVVSTVRF